MFGENSEKEVYIETLKLEEGKGRALANMLVKTLEKQQSRDTVKVIGSDSCSKNTGWDNGVQACVEEELGRPLQRVLCLKHTIEIIWHKYFIALDGETSSPTTLDRPIGKVVSGDSFFRSEIITYSTMPHYECLVFR